MRLAQALAASGAPGDHVAILSDNQPEYVEAHYGVPAARQRLVFLNYRLAVPELVRIVNDARATTLLYAPQFAETVAGMRDELETVRRTLAIGEEYEAFIGERPARSPFADIAHTETAWIIYTSGTTGMPKGAMLSHRNLFASMFNAQVSMPGDVPDAPCFLFPFPLCHIAGFAVVGQHLAGNPVALMAADSPGEWMRMVEELKITGSALAPTMINMLLNDPGIQPHDLGSLRSLGYGASSMSSSCRRPTTCAPTGRCPNCSVRRGRVGALADVRIVDEAGRDCAVDEPGEIVVRGGHPAPPWCCRRCRRARRVLSCGTRRLQAAAALVFRR